MAMTPCVVSSGVKDKSSGRGYGSASSVAERRIIFNRYAENYHERFRAAIDFQFAEEPRQIIGMAVLVLGCCLGGIFCDLRGVNVTDQVAVRIGFLGMFFCLCVYCFLQTRDGLLVRPHPGFWRIFHAVGLTHLIVFCILAVCPIYYGRRLVEMALPGLEVLRQDVFSGTVDLQCELSLRTLKIQMSKLWFTSHILGWFAKMLIFRDWYFCLILSVAFETVELSFQWLIPELRECWWDSIILDFAVSNMIGMLIGKITLRVCDSLSYDWLSRSQSNQVVAHDDGTTTATTTPSHNSQDVQLRQTSLPTIFKYISKRFLPFLWSRYHWSFFRTPERLFQATLLLCLALMTELNVFLMMYALDIPASHTFHKVRVSYLCFLAVSGVAETYHYVNQGAHPELKRRIGHNAWLFVAIILVETFVVLRYGRTRFYKIIPDVEVIIPWTISVILLGIWCFFHFVVIGAERLDVSKKTWTFCLNYLKMKHCFKKDLIKTKSTGNSSSSNALGFQSGKIEQKNMVLSEEEIVDDLFKQERDSKSLLTYRPYLTAATTTNKMTTTATTVSGSSQTEKVLGDDNEETTPYIIKDKQHSSMDTTNTDNDTITSPLFYESRDLEPEKAALKSVIELISIRKNAAFDDCLEQPMNKRDLEVIVKKMIRGRLKWNRMYDIGLYIVNFPPLACFLPLIYLIKFYDYGS